MINPYKELSPYSESDAYRFKGRTSEILEMYECFDRNEYLVCHADSGEGKSSIIEAGLIPKLKANYYYPIRIVFKTDEHYRNNTVNFDDVICNAFDNEVGRLRNKDGISVDVVYPQKLNNEQSRGFADWEKELISSFAWLKMRYSRLTIDNLVYTPVLIFDQFEEVFTNPLSQEWTDRFFAWLQELSTDLCPKHIISEIEKHTGKDEFPEIDTQKHFKAIFSLRSEYVGRLDYWGLQRHYIPLLKNNRYLLRPLTIEGAKEVITQQEGYDGLNDVADEIIDILRKQQKGKNYVMSASSDLPCIPALFLSIVCSRAFNMSQQERSAFIQSLITDNYEEKEAAIYALIAAFYEKAVTECGIPFNDMAVIEDVLVNNEGNRQRVSSHADSFKSIDFSNKYLKSLEKARLIRIIPEYNRDEDCVEFVHDALCPVIIRRKEIRMMKRAGRERLIRFYKFLLGVLTFITIGIAAFSFLNVSEANKKLNASQSRLISEKVNQLLEEGDAYTAQLLALYVLQEKFPYTWEAGTSLLKAFPHHSAILYKLGDAPTISPDGSLIAVCHRDGKRNQIYIVDAFSGGIKKVIKASEASIGFMAFSHDGTLLSAKGSYERFVRLWNLNTGRMDSLTESSRTISSLSFSPDDKCIISSSEDSTVRIWDVKNGNKLAYIKKYPRQINCAKYSWDGSIIALSSNDGIRLLRTTDMSLIDSVLYKRSYCYTNNIGFVSDKKIIYRDDGFARILNFESKEEDSIPCHDCFSVTQDGKALVTDTLNSKGSVLFMWDAENKEIIRTWQEDTINFVDIANNTDYMVVKDNDKNIKIKEIKENTFTNKSFQAYTDYLYFGKRIDFTPVTAAKFSRNGNDIISCLPKKSIMVWNVKTGALSLDISNGMWLSELYIAISPSGKYIAFLTNSGIKVVDLKKREAYLTGLDGQHITFGSDDNYLYFCNKDSIVRWNVSSQIIDHVYKGFPYPINSFCIGAQMIVVTHHNWIDNGTIHYTKQIWNANGNKIIQNINVKVDSHYPDCLSRDGKLIGIIGVDSVLRVFNTYSGKLLFSKTGEFNTIYQCMAFSPQSDKVALGTQEGNVEIFDLNGTPIYKLPISNKRINSLEFSPDGNWIMAGCSGGLIKMTYCPPIQQIIDQTRERFKNRKLTDEEKRRYYLE